MRPLAPPILGALALSFACAGTKTAANGHDVAPATGAKGAEARVLAIGDALVEDGFEHWPERAALLRIAGAKHDRLPDESIAAVETRRAKLKAWLAELQKIDRG
jgi:hypothetical protein